MDFESPDVEKDFPGLYASESSRRSDSDYGDSGHERGGKKELLKSKRKDKKDKSKDKGYAALGEDSSAEEMDLSDARNPLKPKKPKSFKFLHKKDKEEKEKEREEKEERKREEKKREKEEKKEEKKKEKEEKKEEKKKEKEEKEKGKKKGKDKEKEEKKREKERKRSKKDKKKKLDESVEEVEELPVFGQPLAVAVERCKCHDGLKLPAIVRECIDFVEQYGLHCEGIYRLSGVKSKVQQLRRAYNAGDPVRLSDQEPHVVASLLKQYLRELPEPVLTVDLMPVFEDAAMIPDPVERANTMKHLIEFKLPIPNRLLVQYIFKHMGHIIARQQDTKMTYQNVCIVLSPTMQISHRVLNALFTHHTHIFGQVVIKKYIPPIRGCGNDKTVELPEFIEDIEEEMRKQESLLAMLHDEVAAGVTSRKKEEQLWEAQRIVTLLKRKLRIEQKKEEERRERRNTIKEEDSSKESSKDSSNQSQESLQENQSDQTSQEEVNAATPPHKTSHTNVTVVNVVEPISNDVSNEESKEGNEDNSQTKESITQPALASIPVLPKPVSAKFERQKNVFPVTNESRGDDMGLSEEPVDFSDKKCQREYKSENRTAEESRGHVTVIHLGGVQGSSNSSDIVDSKDEVTGNQRQETVHTSQWPEVRRLNPDKVPLRETKSLDDGRGRDENEYLQLLAQEEAPMLAENEELLSMNHDLTRKLQAERAEIARLREEIQEMQTLYGYRTYSYDSSESEGSESDGESETEEEMISELSAMNSTNKSLQADNAVLTQRIQEEREAVVRLRVLLRQNKFQPPQPNATTTVY